MTVAGNVPLAISCNHKVASKSSAITPIERSLATNQISHAILLNLLKYSQFISVLEKTIPPIHPLFTPLTPPKLATLVDPTSS